MHKIIFLLTFFTILSSTTAFAQDAEALRETARGFLSQGDFASALQALDKALTIKPDDLDVLKDKDFIYYLQRDFANAIALGKQLVARADADVQCYQLLGLSYKAIAENKESDKMYKDALKKFPNSGVLYNEYGELVKDSQGDDEAIKYWEKGIESEPNIAGNYYDAAKYYAKKGNIIWGLLYGEIFVNIESYSKRSEEIKGLVYGGYKKLFSNPSQLNSYLNSSSDFEKAVAKNFLSLSFLMKDDLSPEALTILRTRFILNWYNGAGRQMPFQLFERQRTLLAEGYFNAYNQWLIGPVADTQNYQQWTASHADDLKNYQEYQRINLYKANINNYYPHNF